MVKDKDIKQFFQQGEGTDDLFYKYGVGGVVIGRRFFYPF